ncbi:MAG TPA: agmatine deiminase family protein [Acidobacteriota bacterium]
MNDRRTPAGLGYRMPPEWHPHSATWLAWPKDPVTWPDRVPEVQEIFLKMISALAQYETVHLLVDDQATENDVRRRLLPQVQDREVAIETSRRGISTSWDRYAHNVVFHRIPTIDSWIRDYGPNFILRNTGELAYNDWTFNAWGNKYEEMKKDNTIPSKLEGLLKIPRFEPEIVLEGGSIEVDGAGLCMTTEQCLLNRNRNPRLNRHQIENYLKDYLGVEKVLWLGDGIAGDDTDGHIDDLARFVRPTTVVCALEEDPQDENYEPLQDNYRRLRMATNAKGIRYEVVTLPMPGFVVDSEGRRLPASYANFYIANNVVLAPTFGHSNDKRALETLQKLFPWRRVIGIHCESLALGMGTIHCVTQQQPATN